MIESDDANAHVQRKQEAQREISCFTHFLPIPLSPKYALTHPHKGDIEMDYVGEEIIDRVDEDLDNRVQS